jgi:hypothetical protein
MMTSGNWIAPTILVNPFLVEAHDRGLHSYSVIRKERLFYRPNVVLAPFLICRLKQDFVVFEREMRMKEGDAKSLQALVFCQYSSHFLKAFSVAVVDRTQISDMAQRAPLQ